MSEENKDLFVEETQEVVDETAPTNFDVSDETKNVEAEEKNVVEVNSGEIEEEPKADTYVDDLEYDIDDDEYFTDDELDDGTDEYEEPTDEFLEEMKDKIFGEIVEKDNYEDPAPKKEKKKVRKAPTKDNRGVVLSGSRGLKSSKVAANKKYRQLTDGQMMRRGVYKINDDEPVRHVGKGTLQSDIAKKKNKKG